MTLTRFWRALAAGISVGIVASVLVHLYDQFLIYHEHRGETAVRQFLADGTLDVPLSGTFGYDGYITRVDGQPVNVDAVDASQAQVDFQMSYLRRMLRVFRLSHLFGTSVAIELNPRSGSVRQLKGLDVPFWATCSAFPWTIFGIAAIAVVALSLRPRHSEHAAGLEGWFLITSALIFFAGSFILRGYLGLDGLRGIDSFQPTNLALALLIGIVALWLLEPGLAHGPARPFARRLVQPPRVLIGLLVICGIWAAMLSLRVHFALKTGDEKLMRSLCATQAYNWDCRSNWGCESAEVRASSSFRNWECGSAEQSASSTFLGIPLAILGVAGYALIMILLLWDGLLSRLAQLAISLIGTVLAFGMNLQFELSGAKPSYEDGLWCKYCFLSQVVLCLLVLICSLRVRARTSTARQFGKAKLRSVAGGFRSCPLPAPSLVHAKGRYQFTRMGKCKVTLEGDCGGLLACRRQKCGRSAVGR